MQTIARPTTDERVFPPVASMFTADASVDTPGLRLLAAAQSRRSAFQARSGWPLPWTDRVAALVAVHRDATEVETAGQWAKADVLWAVRDRRLDRVSERAWRQSARASGFAGDADQWRRRVLTEVLLDTHVAFYNGYTTVDFSRALVHLEMIESIAERCGFSAADRSALLGPAADARIQALRRSGDLEAAVERAWQRRMDNPDHLEYEREYVDIVVEQATAGLTPGHKPAAQDGGRLESGIAKLTEAIRRFPRHAYAYEAAAVLHRARAVQLANSGALSRALLHLGQAQSHFPEMEGLAEDEKTVTDMMQKLRSEMREVSRQLKGKPNLSLSDEGRRLQSESEVGFSLLTNYRRSDADKQLRIAGADARAYLVWRRAGLPATDDRWAERAQAFLRAINAVIAAQPQTDGEFAAAWRQKAQSDPDIREVPAETVMRLLRDASPSEPAAQRAPADVQVLPVAAASRASSTEPFTYWIFTSRNLLLKGLAATAVVLVTIAGVSTAANAIQSTRRESAWASLLQADNQGDAGRIITEAERFFSAEPELRDSRAEEVLTLYEASLVRWFAELPNEPSADAVRHLDRYKDVKARLSVGEHP